MADDKESVGYVITWSIENFPCYLDKNLCSPSFEPNNFEKTKWYLSLYPFNSPDAVKCYLHRSENDGGPARVTVESDLTFMSSNGSSYGKQTKYTNLCTWTGFSHSVEIDRCTITYNSFLVKKDTLVVRCKMWKGQETCPSEVVECHAFSNVLVNRSFFEWTLNCDQRGNWDVKPVPAAMKPEQYPSCTCTLEQKSAAKSAEYNDIELSFKMTPHNSEVARLYLYSLYRKGHGNSIASGKVKGSDFANGSNISVHLNWNDLIGKKEIHLADHVVTLKAEVVSSDGVVIASGFKKPNLFDDNPSPVERDLCKSLRSLYLNGKFCDVKLRTNTKCFLAHKVILVARSPVFERMFSTDMQENNTHEVNVSEFEDSVVDAILTYAYTGEVGDLDWGSAMKLYYGADKYEMLHLRDVCSVFLRNTVSSRNVCDVLVLSKMHHDSSLELFVQNFISQNRAEVLASAEWNNLENENLSIALDILHKLCLS